jgi:hypothetical protein
MKRNNLLLSLVLSLAFTAVLIPSGTLLYAQTADQAPATGTIKFDRVWPEYTPQNISITVSADGHTKYVSHTAAKPPDEADDYATEFTVSPACRDKLFSNAREASYFDGDFTFKKHAVASSGKKTLTYADTTRHFNTTYDYSENKAIAEITGIFQGISNTIEHGRTLKFKHRFDKLGLEDELKGLESAAESHNLAQLQLIAPELESILEDASVLNIARQRAKRLLAKASSE